MSENDDDDNKEQAEEFAYSTDAVTYILSAADCPKKFRDFIDCLIGMADGNIEFYATDEQIERRRKAIKPISLTGKKEYWARSRRRDLLKWQKENDLVFLEYEKSVYDRKLNRRPPSHFKLYLVKYIQQVITGAKEDKKLWEVNRALSIKEAAQRLVDELRAQPKIIEPEDRYFDPRTEVLRKLNNAKTLLTNTVGLLEKFDFELIKDDEALVTSIEELIVKVRERGFVDPLDMKVITGAERA